MNLFYQPLPIFKAFSQSLLPKCVLVSKAPEVLYNWPEGPHFQPIRFPGTLGVSAPGLIPEHTPGTLCPHAEAHGTPFHRNTGF